MLCSGLCDKEMGVQVAPINVIGSPALSVSSNMENTDNARLLKREDEVPTPVWTPDEDDTEKSIEVEFSDIVTVTAILMQGGLSTDGEEAYVTSINVEYDADGGWKQIPSALPANDDASKERLIALINPVATKV